MYHNAARMLAAVCVERSWISEDQFDWCVYTFEKWILTFVQIILWVFIGLIAQEIVTIAVFAGTVFLLRRRIGGWHAPTAWLCQLLGTAIVFFSTYLIQKFANELPMVVHGVMALGADLCCVIFKPIYPRQLHFNESIIKENNKKKCSLLASFVLVQFWCLVLRRTTILAAINYGIIVSELALVIELFKQKKEGKQNEENRKSLQKLDQQHA